MKFDYKKSLGQNFLKDNTIIKKISSSIQVSKDDLIIEIGPGSGALTKELIKKDSDIICFEIDTRLKKFLDLIKSDKLEIIYEDFLKVDINNYIKKKYNRIIFIGNLPYYITTAIINKIVDETVPDEIVVMIQKEVAQRFMSLPKSREYGSISAYLQYHFDIEKICIVGKNSFEPAPKVDSMVIKLKNKHEKKIKAENEEWLYKLIRDAFKYKRKNLKNNLFNYNTDNLEIILNKIGKKLTNRAEELSVDDFVFISNELNNISK